MEITNAGDVSIGGKATLSVVHRDQYNQTINAQVVHIGREMVKQESENDSDPEYGQYREIIRGDIHKFEQICSVDDWEWEDGRLVKSPYQRTIYRARVYGDDRVLTAISFHGRDAKKIWKKEFMKWSQANDPAVLLQLFAINRSKVPALLFYDGM
ncbi:hypothetical protein WG66_017096 [Moniliophthora roreri]|nr:hypothetical protein WG66_017096 [Moniliophthora roreri]